MIATGARVGRGQGGSLARAAAMVVGIGILAAVNLYLAARSAALVIDGVPALDWDQYVEAGRRVAADGDLYAVTNTYAYRYSPLLAAVFGLVAPIGTVAWRLLHVVAALALPTWPLRILTLVSWPFWYDVETGNLLVFILLAAAWAIRGNRVATGTFLVLVLLIPRPLMIPVAAWLLWKRPAWRVPFIAAFVVQALGVVALGWASGWASTLQAASADVALPSNIGPSRFVGPIPWLLVGIPLSAWLTLKGRIGLASLAASPYWLPYYLVMPLLELVRWRKPVIHWRAA